MSPHDRRARPSRIGLDDGPEAIEGRHTAEPPVEFDDVSVLVRAYYGSDDQPPVVSAGLKDAQITVSRHYPDDFQDRQIYLFVDDEPLGKVRYGESITRVVEPGPHRVRAFNTLYSRTLELDVKPGEHVRLGCGNGFPKAGWLLMLVLHVTYLLVRLEREPVS